MNQIRAIELEEVAERYGVGVHTVRTWISNGDLKAVDCSVKRGSKKKRLRVKPEALEEFEAARCTQPKVAIPRKRPKDPAVTEYF